MSRREEPEHVEQRALFDMAAKHEWKVPELRWLYAVPNGRKRSPAEAGKLKAEGVKAGVLDVHLDVARDGYHGLRIEMKAPGKLDNTSEAQDAWIAHHEAEGYQVHVFDGWQYAWNAIVAYLGRRELLLYFPGAASGSVRSRTRARRA